MGLRDRLGGGKKSDDSGGKSSADAKPEPQQKAGRGRLCMYGHPVRRGEKMCEHRHWVG